MFKPAYWIPSLLTSSLLITCAGYANSASNYAAYNGLNHLQYRHSNQQSNTAVQQKSSWQKPSVHGRGNGNLYLAATQNNTTPKAWPGEMWKGSNNAKPKGNKQFPGEMWKSKSKPKGSQQFPGGMWKPKPRQQPNR